MLDFTQLVFVDAVDTDFEGVLKNYVTERLKSARLKYKICKWDGKVVFKIDDPLVGFIIHDIAEESNAYFNPDQVALKQLCVFHYFFSLAQTFEIVAL
jgi:hypothetical protein